MKTKAIWNDHELELRDILAKDGFRLIKCLRAGSKGYTLIRDDGAIFDDGLEEVESLASTIMANTGTCCICGGPYYSGGRNPWPVVSDEDSRCCRVCDDTVVRQARYKQFLEHIAAEKAAGQ